MKLTSISYTIRILLFLGIFMLIGLLVNRHYFRLDFTEDKRYTLSNITKGMLKELDAPITATVYFPEDINPAFARYKQDLQDLLSEYKSFGGRNFQYTFVNTNKKDTEAREEIAAEAQQAGVPSYFLTVREQDQSSQVRTFIGTQLKMGTKEEFFNLGEHILGPLQSGQEPPPFEYPLTKTIKKLSSDTKPKVGFVQGHGEPGKDAYEAVLKELEVLYEADTVNLQSDSRWTEFSTLLVVSPTDSFPASHLNRLDQFLSSGGRLFVGINTVNGDLQQQTGSPLTTGLESWLAAKGINVEAAFLTDQNCGQVQVPRQMSFMGMNTMGYVPVKFRYLPLITNFGDHPITSGLEALLTIFVSPVNLAITDSSIQTGVLAYTSSKTGKMPGTTRFDIEADINFQQTWTDAAFSYGPQPIAVYAEGKLVGENSSKLVVVGDGEFATNPQPPNNVDFLVNAVDWLADDTGLIELRSRRAKFRLIDKELSEGERTAFKYTIFLLPILIAIFFGIIRAQLRRTRRSRWQEKDYS